MYITGKGKKLERWSMHGPQFNQSYTSPLLTVYLTKVFEVFRSHSPIFIPNFLHPHYEQLNRCFISCCSYFCDCSMKTQTLIEIHWWQAGKQRANKISGLRYRDQDIDHARVALKDHKKVRARFGRHRAIAFLCGSCGHFCQWCSFPVLVLLNRDSAYNMLHLYFPLPCRLWHVTDVPIGRLLQEMNLKR
jgi:hypothetical protein